MSTPKSRSSLVSGVGGGTTGGADVLTTASSSYPANLSLELGATAAQAASDADSDDTELTVVAAAAAHRPVQRTSSSSHSLATPSSLSSSYTLGSSLSAAPVSNGGSEADASLVPIQQRPRSPALFRKGSLAEPGAHPPQIYNGSQSQSSQSQSQAQSQSQTQMHMPTVPYKAHAPAAVKRAESVQGDDAVPTGLQTPSIVLNAPVESPLFVRREEHHASASAFQQPAQTALSSSSRAATSSLLTADVMAGELDAQEYIPSSSVSSDAESVARSSDDDGAESESDLSEGIISGSSLSDPALSSSPSVAAIGAPPGRGAALSSARGARRLDSSTGLPTVQTPVAANRQVSQLKAAMGAAASPAMSIDESFRRDQSNDSLINGDDRAADEDESEALARVSIGNMFKSFREPKLQKVSRSTFLAALASNGILEDDPRLQSVIASMRKFDDLMDYEQFSQAIWPEHRFLCEILQGNLAIPDFEYFRQEICDIFETTKRFTSGNVASYIPQLARVNPEQYAAAICTIDGQRFAVGDTKAEFCVQSCSKPISYALALEERGHDKVHQHVGREPSGVRFNELTLNHEHKPHNPMINSGAIMTCSLIQPEMDMADRFTYVVEKWTAMAGGGRIGFSNATYLSERQTADRNFALAYFMRENHGFPVEVEKNLTEILEFYFQCCSLECNVQTLSVIAGTLANGGICPITNEQVLRPETVRAVLSMMYSCGTYDFSGEFAFKIGIPAKSGVAGALMVVVPNIMGLCIWSPRLDKLGNSVRGIEFCKELCNRFNFHNFDESVHARGKIDPRLPKNHQRHRQMIELCFAASQGDLSAIRRALQKGGGLNECDYDGRTPLHLAASEGHTRVVKYLFQHGAHINPMDRWGNTPLDDAKREQRVDVVELLFDNGALTGAELMERHAQQQQVVPGGTQ
ncbi:glutaminase [Capsaspora owczarzaki ATCC 30864]|uniref:glutaminase n=1 Tax=Capsaspora owczarzaki (strain ATCC 30864) TaxID=595528 RepID=A0A0D2WPP3_CAPO3|nr:glutaminase [Capsaspora owczarzaki ATCC 30864]KJE93435.1 glutaminase [Capsaspora owczarzaki ATCC 30864]|eukprot:XP_004348053.2 glutaminase [Capsaspora owczarzaki ATCC 30864]